MIKFLYIKKNLSIYKFIYREKVCFTLTQRLLWFFFSKFCIISIKVKIFFMKENFSSFRNLWSIIELRTLKILGSVKTFRHVSSPPIVAIIPLFSIDNCIVLVASNPAPVVIESPIAAITSISPGLNRFTESGTVGDLPPTDIKLSNYDYWIL